MMVDQPSRFPLFTPAERQLALERIVAALHTDARIAGVMILGSGAQGFADAYSDIDLSVVVLAETQVFTVHMEWRERVLELFSVLHIHEIVHSPSHMFYGFLIDGYLELNMSFIGLANLYARRREWKILYDNSDRIEGIMNVTWGQRPKPNIKINYLNHLNSVGHYIIQVVIALRRGKMWRAYHELGEIRNRAVELAGWRHEMETRRFRGVDRLPPETLAKFERTLVVGLNPRDILRALRATVAAFFNEARQLDEVLEIDVAKDLAHKMMDYLDTVQ